MTLDEIQERFAQFLETRDAFQKKAIENMSVPKEYLVGYKGMEYKGAGIVYAPYIPMMTTPVIYDSSSFSNIKPSIKTRYSKPINTNFYTIINPYNTNSTGSI